MRKLKKGYVGIYIFAGNRKERQVAAQPPVENPNHAVSFPPPLGTIMEWQSMEEREEEECSQLPRSPIQDYIDSCHRRTPLYPGCHPGHNDEDEGM